MRSREKDRDRSDDCEQREEYQANSVDDHGSKLPVIVHVRILFVVSDLVSDDTQLLEDA